MSDKPIPPSVAQHALQTCLSENGEQIGMAATIAQQAELIRLQAAEIERLNHAPVQHPDSAAVDRFAYEMKMKMAASRDKGRSGWDDKTRCTDRHLASLLVKHLTKGNPGTFVDIANFAMMLHQRSANPQVLQIAALKQAGVVMPGRCNDQSGERFDAGWDACLDEVTRLNASRDMVPEGWAKMDPSFVVEHIRRTSHFDAGMIEAMLDYAIRAAATTPAPAVERCDTCHGQGEVWTGENQSFGYMSMQPPEPIMEDCPECGGDTVKPDHSADDLKMVRVPRELANRLISTDNHVRQTARRELRNMLLAGGAQ